MRFLWSPKLLLPPLAVGIYLCCCFIDLELPGLYYDEVLFANAAMGNIDGSFVAWQIHLGSAKLPVMLMPYIGALKAYLYVPIFAIFKPDAMSGRLPPITLGIITLMLTYAVAKTWLGEKVALLSLLLLASDPTFIFANKLDWSPAALMMVIRMVSLYLLKRWLTAGKLYLLALAGFLLGLGVYDKVIFIWFVAALLIAFPLCFWKNVRPRLNWTTLCVFLSCLALGCGPVIAYNWRFNWMTLNNPNKLNLSLAQETWLRSITLVKTLNGTATNEFTSNEDFQRLPLLLQREGGAALHRLIQPSGQYPGTLTVPALVIAVTLILVLWKRGRLPRGASVQFFLLLYTLITLFIYLTPGSAGLQHFVMLYPFHTILIAFAACSLGNKSLDQGRAIQARERAGLACAGILILSQLLVDVETLKSFSAKGGVGTWSDAIYRLADYASAHKESSFTLMDWGFSNQLLLLTQGQVRKQEAFTAVKAAPGDEEQIRVMHAFLIRPKSIVVFHAPGYEIVPMRDLFERTQQRYKLTVRKVATFCQRDGQPVYLLYEVSPSGTQTSYSEYGS